ncbi:hypothetical protein [Streptomyces sp. ALB3]|uniref:hypothetical protein n=1 Tax=Streptomyces sp. ALB3 TaxID=3374278 RepID=UPI0037AEF47A
MHRRRRTALALSAATLVAAPLLTACGGEAHPGAAAVVGGDRIDVATLQAQAADVRSAQLDSKQPEKLVTESGRLIRAKLSGMILGKILDRATEDAGVSVSRKEIQQIRGVVADQSGGEEGVRTRMLEQSWVAPGQIDETLRTEVQIQKLARALGVDLQSPAGMQAVQEALARTSEELHIDVNPRYGSWDDRKVQLSTYQAPWIKQVTRAQGEEPEAGA